MSTGRLLRLRLGEVRPGLFTGGVREPGQRLQLLLVHAFPEAMPDYLGEHRRRGHDPLLPDQLRPG